MEILKTISEDGVSQDVGGSIYSFGQFQFSIILTKAVYILNM